jgi:hypothetical protein
MATAQPLADLPLLAAMLDEAAEAQAPSGVLSMSDTSFPPGVPSETTGAAASLVTLSAEVQPDASRS